MTTPRYTEIADLADDAPSLREIRHHIHHHPELAYEEVRTAALVADKLDEWGWQVTRGVGGTGVVGTLKVGDGTRSIGLRADMDALPIIEQTGKPYASATHGKMHACGHDGHTTMLLGAARHLARTRRFSGTVHLYFQPAEEHGVPSGAQKMIADGLFERFPCDAVFGVHNHPGVRAGMFLFRKGPFMAAGDKVTITIEGVGGHAARPHLTVDPVVVAASIVMALQTIVARNVDPSQPAVVTVGSMHAGTANNVIPSSRDAGTERALVQRRKCARCSSGASPNWSVAGRELRRDGDGEVSGRLSGRRQFGRGNGVRGAGGARTGRRARTSSRTPIMLMGSEDFAFMLQERPGSFLRIGNGAGEDGCMVHNPHYDFNDKNLPVGAAYWARLVERFLRDKLYKTLCA